MERNCAARAENIKAAEVGAVRSGAVIAA